MGVEWAWTRQTYLSIADVNQEHPISKLSMISMNQCAECHHTWSASISTVFIVNLLEQKLKRSSRLGPNRSMTRQL